MPDIHCLFEQAECISLIHPACLNKQSVSAWYTLPTSRVYQPDTPCLQAECISLIHSVCLNMQYMFENKDYLLAESTWALVNNSLIWQKITWWRPLNCQYGTWQSTVSLVLWHLWGEVTKSSLVLYLVGTHCHIAMLYCRWSDFGYRSNVVTRVPLSITTIMVKWVGLLIRQCNIWEGKVIHFVNLQNEIVIFWDNF